MLIFYWLGRLLLGYASVGILYWIITNLYFRLTNRYRGNGWLELGWFFEIGVAVVMWPLLIVNTIKDYRWRKRRVR